MVVLYRGHKHPDFLKTYHSALCFSEKISVGISYGLGNNDASNLDVKDGFVTVVEFHGEISDVTDSIALDLCRNSERIHDLSDKYPAVRTRDGAIIVLDLKALKNPVTHPAKSVSLGGDSSKTVGNTD